MEVANLKGLNTTAESLALPLLKIRFKTEELLNSQLFCGFHQASQVKCWAIYFKQAITNSLYVLPLCHSTVILWFNVS